MKNPPTFVVSKRKFNLYGNPGFCCSEIIAFFLETDFSYFHTFQKKTGFLKSKAYKLIERSPENKN